MSPRHVARSVSAIALVLGLAPCTLAAQGSYTQQLQSYQLLAVMKKAGTKWWWGALLLTAVACKDCTCENPILTQVCSHAFAAQRTCAKA